MERSISLFVQDGRAECDFIVERLSKSDNRKSSGMRSTKTVRKGLMSRLSINTMDKVKQFFVISKCSSENSSGVKLVSVYHFRETVVSMISNTIP